MATHEDGMATASEGDRLAGAEAATVRGGVFLTLRWRLCRLRQAVMGLTGWRHALTTMGAGALGVLAMAPFFLPPVLIVSMTLFVWLLDGAAARPLPQAVRRGAWTAWLFSFGYLFPGLAWIGEAFLVDAETFAALMPFAISLLPAGLSLFVAAVIGPAMVLWRPNTLSRVFLLAALWMLGEWLRGHLLTGFPWNLIGLTWVGWLEVGQTAAWIGSYGLSALTVAWAASFACLADGPARLWHGRLPVATTAVMILLAGLGAWRLAASDAEPVPDVTIRIVQPNTPQQERMDRTRHDAIWERLLSLTEGAGAAGVTHVIWPEAAPPGFLAREPGRLDQIARALGPGVVLLTGSLRAENDGAGGYRFFNGFYIVDDRGRLLSSYDKSHLVPFGEYLPFQSVLSLLGLQQVAQEIGTTTPGDGPRTLSVPGAPPVGPLICYEIIFPGAATEPGNRPAWIANVTDDVWFGDTIGPRQHLAIARMRAIEEGLPIIRAANGGISAVVDAHGRLRASLGLHERGARDVALPGQAPPTQYSRTGDGPFIFLALGVLLSLLLLRLRAYVSA